MIEDALFEANRLQEANAVPNAGGQQQGQPSQGQAEVTPPKPVDAETIKDHISKNPKIDDWPEEWLAELTGFLQGQDSFKSSKSAQAMVKAIQQKQTEAAKDPEKEKEAANDKAAGGDDKAPASDGSNGSADKVPPTVTTRVFMQLQQNGLGKTFTLDDLIAAMKADKLLGPLVNK